MASGAIAATQQPAAGNEPVIEQPAAPASTLTRSAVEAQAAKDLPAAGQASEKRENVSSKPELTRAQVEASVKKAEKKAGGFPDASGQK